MGKTCVCGAEELEVDAAAKTVTVHGTVLGEGDLISIDGSTGEVFAGFDAGGLRRRWRPTSSRVWRGGAGRSRQKTGRAGPGGRHPARARRRPRRMRGPRERRHPRGRRARSQLGAEGIGLSRTEHMFLGDRRR